MPSFVKTNLDESSSFNYLIRVLLSCIYFSTNSLMISVIFPMLSIIA